MFFFIVLAPDPSTSIWVKSNVTDARSMLTEVGRNVAFVSTTSLECKFTIYYHFDSWSQEQIIYFITSNRLLANAQTRRVSDGLNVAFFFEKTFAECQR